MSAKQQMQQNEEDIAGKPTLAISLLRNEHETI